MDATERKMTKIAREVSKFTVQTMKEDGIGTAEFDFIHLVRHNPGITQAAVREQLKIDKLPQGVRRVWRARDTFTGSPTRRMAGASCCMPRRRRSS